MTDKQTREEFEKAYCERSKITVKQFRKEYVALPCECSDEECPGWAAVRATPMSINTHMELYFPESQAQQPERAVPVVPDAAVKLVREAEMACQDYDEDGGMSAKESIMAQRWLNSLNDAINIMLSAQPQPPKAVPDCPFNPGECANYCKCDDHKSWDE